MKKLFGIIALLSMTLVLPAMAQDTYENSSACVRVMCPMYLPFGCTRTPPTLRNGCQTDCGILVCSSSSSNSSPAYTQTRLQCVGAAVDVRETNRLAAWSTFAQSTATDMQTRRAAYQQAYLLTNGQQRQRTINQAQIAFHSTGVQILQQLATDQASYRRAYTIARNQCQKQFPTMQQSEDPLTDTLE
jgi:N-acetylglutamate synthase/N-acetylornithine aminotransferase